MICNCSKLLYTFSIQIKHISHFFSIYLLPLSCILFHSLLKLVWLFPFKYTLGSHSFISLFLGRLCCLGCCSSVDICSNTKTDTNIALQLKCHPSNSYRSIIRLLVLYFLFSLALSYLANKYAKLAFVILSLTCV